jgi:hypothetical protein
MCHENGGSFFFGIPTPDVKVMRGNGVACGGEKTTPFSKLIQKRKFNYFKILKFIFYE